MFLYKIWIVEERWNFGTVIHLNGRSNELYSVTLFYFIVFFVILPILKMEQCDFNSESKIIDDLSDFSCHDWKLSDNDSYFSHDSDILPQRKHSSIYLSNSDSESDENGLDTGDELDWTETDKMLNLEMFLDETNVKALQSYPTYIIDRFHHFLEFFY